MNSKYSEYNTDYKRAVNIVKRENANIYTIKKNSFKQLDLENLNRIIEEGIKKDVKLFVIDHLQEFKVEGDKNDKLNKKVSDMMYQIKAMAEYHKVVIFLVSHFRKTDGVPNENSFLDSIAISQVANKIIILYRDKLVENSDTKIIIAKNREKGNGTGVVNTQYEYKSNDYFLTKSEYQLAKERIYYNNHPL